MGGLLRRHGLQRRQHVLRLRRRPHVDGDNIEYQFFDNSIDHSIDGVLLDQFLKHSIDENDIDGNGIDGVLLDHASHDHGVVVFLQDQ
jgi:hypothetical protein